MGVLADGTPYLALRGPARMCGVEHSQIVRMTAAWLDSPLKPREQKIRETVKSQGADDSIAFYAVNRSGTIHHMFHRQFAWRFSSIMHLKLRALTARMQRNRLLAREGFEAFIYSQVGYNPSGAPDIAWKQFHDRVSLSYHTVPDGYFSVFKELADITVTLIRSGANLGQASFQISASGNIGVSIGRQIISMRFTAIASNTATIIPTTSPKRSQTPASILLSRRGVG